MDLETKIKVLNKISRVLHDLALAYCATLLSLYYYFFFTQSGLSVLAKAKFLAVPGYLNKMFCQKSSFPSQLKSPSLASLPWLPSPTRSAKSSITLLFPPLSMVHSGNYTVNCTFCSLQSVPHPSTTHKFKEVTCLSSSH